MEKPKTAQHLGRKRMRGEWFVYCGEIVPPFPPDLARRWGGGPPHSLCALLVARFLHLEPFHTCRRITILKLHHYHAISLRKSLKPASGQIDRPWPSMSAFRTCTPDSLPIYPALPGGQVPRDACMWHTFASKLPIQLFSWPGRLFLSLPFHLQNSLKSQSNTHFTHPSFHD